MADPIKFRTIIADPPWQYGDRMLHMVSTGNGAAAKYNTLDTADIRNFLVERGMSGQHESGAPNIASFIADDAYLWLWVTNAFVDEGHNVCRGWGFVPKTMVTWVKGRLSVEINDDRTVVPELIQHIGQGHHLRNTTEHVILAVRGSMHPKVRNLPTAFVHPGRWPGRLHSEKPRIIHEWAEQLSDGPYLEIFARRQRENWSVIGDQCDTIVAS